VKIWQTNPLENEINSTYGVAATDRDPQPLNGVVYGYALNIGRCIGCRKCVYACMKENNLSRDPQAQYIRVLKMKKEGQGGFRGTRQNIRP
jgi:Fe-S-cluster-containing dehydrogenase component